MNTNVANAALLFAPFCSLLPHLSHRGDKQHLLCTEMPTNAHSCTIHSNRPNLVIKVTPSFPIVTGGLSMFTGSLIACGVSFPRQMS
ncbi:hypothetical protein BV22DRAFT_1028602 [Leucogyrophana mollusca]|uniref:Uncharacterized protein n=1 Tax=Leucogyrophana mollusca TaxID=85980 RepID=A0ACB8BWM6_9AGAM|nr:hypothetical protein BV22DRAFT_1028602 [Leucogyrophana mollusca]